MIEKIKQAIKELQMHRSRFVITVLNPETCNLAIAALEKQLPKKVYYFLDDDTFETTCCGVDVTNQDYTYCPYCGSLLGKVEEVK